MSFALGLETATTECSVALFSDGVLIDHIREGGDYSHAENLAVFVDSLLKRNQILPKQLDAVFLSIGPGSYTGLRIGTSFAKGLCYSLEIPLVGINSLMAMSYGAILQTKNSEAYYCPMTDARRMEVYTCLFDYNLNKIEETSAKIIEVDSFQKVLAEKQVYFFGNGAEKCKSILQHENALFLNDNFHTAIHLGNIGQEKLTSGKVENLAYFEPNYLKDFVAGGQKN